MADKYTELAEIKRFGGTPQKNSGRGQNHKGDATVNKFLVDVKEYKKSYSVSKENWGKVCTDAVQSGMQSAALAVVLGESDGRKTRLWVISESDMLEYLELLNARDGIE